MTKTIFINASELAKLTGHNKFEDFSKTIKTILSRNKLSNDYIAKSNTEESLRSLKSEQLACIRNELTLPKTATIKEIESVIKNTVINKSLSNDMTEDTSKSVADKTLLKTPMINMVLKSGIKKDIQMKRGNVKEEKNLNLSEKKEKIVIKQRNSQMYSKVLFVEPGGKYKTIIRGKVDGIMDDTIVETKNRSRRLFHNIPGYEKVQIEAYMFLTGLDKAIHIECYNDEQVKTDYVHNGLFWYDCVGKINGFIKDNIVQHIK
jgi:hypothetical protein